MLSSCPNCKKDFQCGANDEKPCWCCSLPNIVPMDSEACLCEECLRIKIREVKKINILNDNTISEALKNLKSNALPLFGIMSPQHMIEHLILALSFSNGKSPQPLMVNENLANRIKHSVINTEKEISIGFKAPMLDDNLLPLAYPNLETALEYLKKEIELFHYYFKTNPNSKPISPVIGELNYTEWIVFHNKHFTHHFKQFGLL